jgi:predicted ester cyclase
MRDDLFWKYDEKMGDSIMPSDENKLLVRRFYEEVVNRGNVDLIERFIAPEYIEVSDGKRHVIGVEGAKAHIVGVRQTYPDLHIEIERQISEGKWVATSITARGIHRGQWLGIKPTGKAVAFTGVNIDRVVGGRIAEHGGAANMLGPFLEIGAIKVVGPDE